MLRRTNPSDTASPPQRARRSALVCTPPKLVASYTSLDAAKKRVTAAASSRAKLITPPKRVICLDAMACDGSVGKPGYRTPCTFGCAASIVAICIAVSH